MNPEDDIKQTQLRLQQKGLYTGAIDGIMGAATQDAVKREAALDFQRAGVEGDERRKNDAAAAALQNRKDALSKLDPGLQTLLTGLDQKDWGPVVQNWTDRQAAKQSLAVALAKQPPELQARLTGVDQKDWPGVIKSYNDEQESAAMRRSAVETGATVAGAATGYGAGMLGDRYGHGKYDEKLGAINDKIEGLSGRARIAMAMQAGPERDAALAGVTKAADTADVNAGMDSRFLPLGRAAVGAGVMLPMGAYSTFMRAPESKSDFERAMWTGTGYGELAGGGKLIASAIGDRFERPRVPLNTSGISDIEAAKALLDPNTARANSYSPVSAWERPQIPAQFQPPAPPPEPSPALPPPSAPPPSVDPLKGQRREVLKAIATHEGLDASGKVEDLTKRIKDHVSGLDEAGQQRIAGWLEASPAEGEGLGAAIGRRLSSLPGRISSIGVALAGAGASLGSDAASHAAEAANMDSPAATKAAPIAGGAAGAAAGYGTAKGLGRLASAIMDASPAAARAIGAAGRALPVIGNTALMHDFLAQARPGDFMEPSLPAPSELDIPYSQTMTPEARIKAAKIAKALQAQTARGPEDVPPALANYQETFGRGAY